MRISDWSSDVCSSDLRRGPRLEDERGLDLVQLAVAHGGDGVPARARGHLFGTELLAAPRAQDYVRRAPPHFGRVLQAARLRLPPHSSLREHGVTQQRRAWGIGATVSVKRGGRG